MKSKMTYLALIGIMLTIAIVLTSCTPKTETPPPNSPTPTPIAEPTPAPLVCKASWEKYPENRPWTDFTAEIVSTELYQDLDAVRDADFFCPAFSKLGKAERVCFWTELVSQMALYESAWKPTSRMVETTMGTDPVTGRQVVSEGLLQLSYQDVRNHPEAADCGIDWSKDKSLASTSPKKTILDPIVNLRCGLRILAKQVKRTGKIVIGSGAYWAVIKEGSKYRKLSEISTATKKLKFCEVKK